MLNAKEQLSKLSRGAAHPAPAPKEAVRPSPGSLITAETRSLTQDEILEELTELSAAVTDPAAKAAVDAEVAYLTDLIANPPEGVFVPRGSVENAIAYRLTVAAMALPSSIPPDEAIETQRDAILLSAGKIRVSADPDIPVKVDQIKQAAARMAPPVEPMPDVPPVTLAPESATHPDTGGPGNLTVTVTGPGASGTWTVEKQAEATWISVVSPTAPQTDSGSVIYNVGATAAARVGYLYINGKTFTVNQDGPALQTAKANAKK